MRDACCSHHSLDGAAAPHGAGAPAPSLVHMHPSPTRPFTPLSTRQERNNQKGLEAQGIADEWKSEGRGYGRRHNDNDGGRYGGRKHRYDDDASDWQEEKHYGKRERKYGRKHRHHHDEEESYGGKKQRGYGRKHRKGGRADIGDSTGDWGAEDRAGRGGSGVPATYHYYSPAYETSSLYCADAFRNKAGRELLKRPWVSAVPGGLLGGLECWVACQPACPPAPPACRPAHLAWPPPSSLPADGLLRQGRHEPGQVRALRARDQPAHRRLCGHADRRHVRHRRRGHGPHRVRLLAACTAGQVPWLGAA